MQENSTSAGVELTADPDIIRSAPEHAPAPEPTQPAPAPTGDGQVKPEAPTEEQPKDPVLDAIRARFPGKDFKSADDFFKSYSGLESSFTVLRQAGLTPEEALARLVRPAAPAEEPAKEEPFDTQGFFDRFAEDPRGALSDVLIPAVMKQVTERITVTLAVRDAWGKVLEKIPDAASYDAELGRMSPAIAAMVGNGVSLPDAMERAVRLIKGETPSPDADREKIRAEEREKARGQVLGTVVEPGKGGGSPQVATGAEKVVDDLLSTSGGLTLRQVG